MGTTQHLKSSRVRHRVFQKHVLPRRAGLFTSVEFVDGPGRRADPLKTRELEISRTLAILPDLTNLTSATFGKCVADVYCDENADATYFEGRLAKLHVSDIKIRGFSYARLAAAEPLYAKAQSLELFSLSNIPSSG